MADEGSSKKPAKKKCPTALKRIKQDKERNLRNRSFKSSVRTAVRSFESALSTKDKEKMQIALNAVYSLMDRGVKQGVYKRNKAARTKARVALLQKSA
ncbi:MAG: 30S ribosomal protein S20 [Chlamydiia bacterium]|nr:30S ribosomal protein S20 [Chlamydiia bacterium]